MSMKEELVLKEKNQLSIDVNSFDGIVSIQKLQLSIKETLATNDELYFIDEIEKIVCEIGNKTAENNHAILLKKYESLQERKQLCQDFIDDFDKRYYEKKEQIKQERKEKENLLSEEQERKKREHIKRSEKGEITKEQLRDLVMQDSEFYNQQRVDLKNFKDIKGMDLRDASSYYLETLAYKKLASDSFSEQERKEKDIKEKELEDIKKQITSIEKLLRSLTSVNFNSYMSEFASIFIKESFKDIDISEDIKKIRANLNKLKSSLLPVAIITDAKINAVIPVICKLIINTTFYGKKDNDTIFKNAKALVEDIEEFSYYAIQRGVKEYCRNNKDYPALKDLVDVIQPKHNKGLMLFANIQFLLSL